MSKTPKTKTALTLAPVQETLPAEKPRQLTRHETHDLSMIIKDRVKVLKAHADEQAKSCLADFEQNMAAVYKFDDDEVWKKAMAEASEAVEKAAAEVAKRCEKLGIPRAFAPTITVDWRARGENMMKQRREELRRVGHAQIEAMKAATMTRIEHQALDLRTQVVTMGVVTPQAKLFLESLAPIDDSMRALNFKEVEKKFDADRAKRLKLADRRDGGYYFG